jgi:hypothetical protein
MRYAPTEAAYISDLPVREVQKAFDEDWFDLEPRQTANRTRRAFGLAELLHLRLSLRYAQSHPRLGRPKKRPWQSAETR